MRLPTLLLALCASAAVAAPAGAQYRLQPGDTLRYHERTETRRVTQFPSGPSHSRTLHDAELAVAPVAADTVRGWYASLQLEQSGAGLDEGVTPTGGVIGRPFVFTLDPRGRAKRVSVPSIPDGVTAVADLTRQFDDLFVTLPTEPLAVGVEWADTVADTRPARGMERYERNEVRRYRVERDTATDLGPALLISIRTEIEMRISAEVRDSPLTASVSARGTEEGTALFSPSLGRLLRRERQGRLQGTMTLRGAGTPRDFPQIYEYTSALELRADPNDSAAGR